ncbi:MAG TPA: Asp-tRNA(Asn)/Glu-tRNA(Gln) amidotransferase subunit GatC [Candidatus Hydrothermia bacterium]|nr:Asp-tRNA(Asn)/Glu-tRNA(Gln) amidotransferase subunit GatC [Candidatus Hydrothermae bacterium]MDD3648697.1 Asp-tRNA(Asn)/Glu-tRNA(Gln) amidotransferase subunit GatC [Candidatus Hydrothermia bacterium]MDD5572791.1 Asp-tRNA(Asn)/Glu-tRNA(Gln) amidotransferase subunit GatC [Candidatus Hydrothermia bacterium]HOK22443.1 Asp-tRNA(Asn)/Glu-tRNA(Gln) amidotransferase subunit GatC [Candidatus Hydrothermia bacterium]HOL23150.1 Asp-tRNA(Asn)/Glu-tRNA(Gln) amidotransferase subunit GatC [Candidatus Hydrot
MKEIVQHILNLAKLYMDENEAKQMEEHLNNILMMVDKLREIDTENVEPLYYPYDELTLRFREDTEKESLAKFEVLENSPESFSDFIKAPSPLKGVIKKSL